jgi:hypothetical protein
MGCTTVAFLSPDRRIEMEPYSGADCARVAGGQDYETRYEARKTGRSKPAVKKALKKVGNSRKRVERSLSR